MPSCFESQFVIYQNEAKTVEILKIYVAWIFKPALQQPTNQRFAYIAAQLSGQSAGR